MQVVIALTFFLSFICQLFLPWWIIVPISAFAAFLKGSSGWKSFIACFFSIFLLWCGIAGYMHVQNNGILASRLALLFSLPSGDWLPIVTGFVGGIVAGLGGVSGYQLRQLLHKPI
ncbi:MAG: hypothetical protein NZ108_06205 [Bacteroidia bacterium]|nr:hypothetical protein [Bacteroidia bacterium]